MTLVEMIKTFDAVPVKFEFPTGEKYEVFMRRKVNNKGYIIMVWQMVNGIQDRIIWDAYGSTPDEARDKLKNRMLKHLTDKGL